MPRKTSKTTEPSKRAPRAKKNGAADAAPTAAPPEATLPAESPSPEQIRARAYEIFRTGANHDPAADWLQAERELRAEVSA
jgi:hypothetical protein